MVIYMYTHIYMYIYGGLQFNPYHWGAHFSVLRCFSDFTYQISQCYKLQLQCLEIWRKGICWD